MCSTEYRRARARRVAVAVARHHQSSLVAVAVAIQTNSTNNIYIYVYIYLYFCIYLFIIYMYYIYYFIYIYINSNWVRLQHRSHGPTDLRLFISPMVTTVFKIIFNIQLKYGWADFKHIQSIWLSPSEITCLEL